MTDSAETIALDMPVQHLDAPRFCAADSRRLSEWAEQLPRGDLGNTSHQLFDALQELNSCKLEPGLRFELLEVLRPLVYSVCGSLAIHYHNQPIVLPTHAFQVYLLSQTMQLQLATGYQIVANDAPAVKSGFLSKKPKNPALLTQALHRAITDLSCTLFRGCLIYSGTGPNIWRQLHTLYRYSCSQNVQDQTFKDLETGQVYPISVEQCYIKALLLGSVRSNQLRQEDLTLLFDSLSDWVTRVKLADFDSAEEDHIVVNLDSDDPPVFHALFVEPVDSSHCRMLVVDELLHHLSDVLADKHRTALSDDMIKHLLISWSSYTRRTFVRMDSRDALQVCVGMSNLHYFSADKTEFEDFIRGNVHQTFQSDGESNPFLKQQGTMRHEDRDLWSSPFRAEAGVANMSLESIDNHIRKYESEGAQETASRSYDDHQVEMVNVSAGGYALEWPADAAARLSNGEIVGIRENNHANWALGIVSWIQRSGVEVAQMGVKLLAPSVIPYAARVVNHGSAAANDSVDDFRRVLLLPEIKLIGQPATLITSQVYFCEKQTLQLVQQGRHLTIRLRKLLSASGVIKQFDIDVVDKPWQQNYGSETERARFDELWNSL